MNKGAMSTSRVAEADAMAVDEAGGVAPSREWMQAAQRALETDGILDGSPAKRHKVCICICTLMSQHTCTPKLLGESLSEDVPVRVSRAYILLERTLLFPKKRSLLQKGPLRLPPKSLPNPCRSRVGERGRRVRMCEPHPDDRMDSKSRPCESAERGVQ